MPSGIVGEGTHTEYPYYMAFFVFESWTYAQVMKTGKGGGTYIEYPDYIEALAKLAQIKFDHCDGPIQLFNRLVNHELVHKVTTN